MRPHLFVFYETPETMRGSITKQMLYNEHFYETVERINNHMVEYDLTYEWKESMIKIIASSVGYPVKISKWKQFLANVFMM